MVYCCPHLMVWCPRVWMGCLLVSVSHLNILHNRLTVDPLIMLTRSVPTIRRKQHAEEYLHCSFSLLTQKVVTTIGFVHVVCFFLYYGNYYYMHVTNLADRGSSVLWSAPLTSGIMGFLHVVRYNPETTSILNAIVWHDHCHDTPEPQWKTHP